MNIEMETRQLKITWKDLKSACERAGVQDDDPLDTVHITWGSIDALSCRKDADFGWQIILDRDCATEHQT